MKDCGRAWYTGHDGNDPPAHDAFIYSEELNVLTTIAKC